MTYCEYMTIVQPANALCKLHKKKPKTLCNLLIDKMAFVML